MGDSNATKIGRRQRVSKPFAGKLLVLQHLIMVAIGALLLLGTAATSAFVPNFHGCVSVNSTGLPYCNSKLSIDSRLEDLVGRLTLEEKVGLISPAHHTPSFSAGVPRLGVPIYNWLTEANTAVQAACVGPDRCPTQFPGPLNMASSFNRSNWRSKGTILGMEQRALGNARDVECYGPSCAIRNLPPLTAWGPNINVVRHPLFGRNSELPGESPFLNGHYAKEVVAGLQKQDSKGHPLVLAYLKHFTMYNGPQATNTPKEMVSLHDIHETYLAQYKIAFVEGNATGAMCSCECATASFLCLSLRFYGIALFSLPAVRNSFPSRLFSLP